MGQGWGEGVRGYDPLLHHDFPLGEKLLPDIAEADTLFGDMIPSYTAYPDRRRFRGYDPSYIMFVL